MYDAIAKGFDRASGDIFCYLNADDLLECGGLLSVGNYFANNQNMHVIYHEDIVMVGEWKYPNIKQPKNISTIDFLCGHILFQDGVFWRRTAYETVGGLRRDLKLAGDFDLWLRLSARFRFIKRPNHVSCFRIRDGQLSGDIGNYHEEMTVCIEDFLSNTHILSRSLNPLKKRLRAVFKRIEMSRQKRFHYSIDSSAIPPTTNECIEPITGIPRSPIDGEPDLSYIYYDERHQIAITHPPVPAARLDSLYRKHYSHPPSEMVLPKGKSPYRYYNGMKIWERIVLRLPVECLVRFIPNTWDDDTLNELCKILKKSGLNTKSSLRFLDTGCFEGHLLSQVREKTHWNAFGIEPNQAAVETARSKGHQVWIGYAEDATAVIPKHHQFDVIYMGQSIEHVDDPVLVLKKLRQILAPGGILVMSTPNLDSRQIDWFGPTWAHWHTPYHRHIFSPNSLVALAQQVGLLPIKLMSFSHPYWTTMSVAQNWLGLGGSTSHAVTFDRSFTRKAQRIHFWNYVLWNRIGKGDYCFISMKDGSDD
jgi:SAM-dependent methyltransferase